MKHLPLWMLLSISLLFGVSCGKEPEPQPLPQPVKVTGITLNSTSITLIEGEKADLIATISPKDAENQKVIWSSSNGNVASVDNGKVTAIKSGNATITAKSDDGGFTATCSLIVESKTIEVTSIELSKNVLSLVEGESETLIATVKPDNATDKTVIWNSSDESIATVNDGKVTAIKEGSVTIGAKAGDKSATCKVTVAKKIIEVKSIELSDKNINLTEGESATLVATVKPDDATDRSVTWTSSDESIVSVEDGKVTAIKEGEATITAKAGNETATCVVTVEKKSIPVESIQLSETRLSLTEGDTKTIIATVKPDDATDKTVIWSSSNNSIVSVSNSGMLNAVKAGTATITASCGGKTSTCSVTVNAKTVHVTGVNLNTTSISLTVGDTRTLTATVTPSNATNKTVTWASSNTSVAKVSSSGTVTAVSTGKVNITVRTSDGGYSATCVVSVVNSSPGNEWVDLGLSVKWATCNLGASKPEEYGDYYAWGETVPKTDYSWANYKWANGKDNKLTKYCTTNYHWDGTGIPDNKSQLDLEDDAAHVTLGGKWRMPTVEEWTELIEKCQWEVTTQNGVNGMKVTGPNGNSIFIIAAGFKSTEFHWQDKIGYYWSSLLVNGVNIHNAQDLMFAESKGYMAAYSRCTGLPIRPVYSD